MVEMVKMWSTTRGPALCVWCLIFSLKCGKVRTWLIYFLLLLKTGKPSERVETNLFAACVPRSILLTNRCEGNLNRTAVHLSPNWLADLRFCFCTVYIVFIFFKISCLFYFLWFRKKKSEIKNKLNAIDWGPSCLATAFRLLFLRSGKCDCRRSLLMRTQPALILCLTKSNHTRSALIKVLLSTGAVAIKMIKMYSKQLKQQKKLNPQACFS